MKKENLVTQSNNLIEAKHTSPLTTREQKIILTVVSMIEPEDEDFKTYRLAISEFHHMMGLNGREKYTELKDIARRMYGKTIEIPKKDGGFLITGWISSAEYIPNEGIIEFSFDPKLKPYLLQLQNAFTPYKLRNILSLGSVYAIRLYELMKKWEKVVTVEYYVDDLKEKLGLKNKYKQYGHLKDRVLKKAKEEINKKTDINISFKEIKKGRKVEKIRFTIKTENLIKQKEMDLDNRINKELFQQLNELAEGYEITHEAFSRLEEAGKSIWGVEKYQEQLKLLILYVNEQDNKKSPIGLALHILSDKVKLAANGLNTDIAIKNSKVKREELIPDWLNQQQKEDTTELSDKEREDYEQEKLELEQALKKYQKAK